MAAHSLFDFLDNTYDFLFGESKKSKPIPILCKGDWYYNDVDTDVDDDSINGTNNDTFYFSNDNNNTPQLNGPIQGKKLMEYLLKRDLTSLSQEDELVMKSRCAHHLIEKNGIIDNLYESEQDCYLYLCATYETVQITVLDIYGKVLDFYPVYDIMGNYAHKMIINDMNLHCNTLYKTYGSRIKLIVGFDAIYHLLKKRECPVLEDKSPLPEYITTTGKDFDKLVYLTNFYPDTPMIVVRKFRMNDGTLRKITFTNEDERYFITLGNNSVKLVEPLKGNPIKSFTLPEGWQTSVESMSHIAGNIRTLLSMAEGLESGNLVVTI